MSDGWDEDNVDLSTLGQTEPIKSTPEQTQPQTTTPQQPPKSNLNAKAAPFVSSLNVKAAPWTPPTTSTAPAPVPAPQQQFHDEQSEMDFYLRQFEDDILRQEMGSENFTRMDAQIRGDSTANTGGPPRDELDDLTEAELAEMEADSRAIRGF
eukprot:TRINITY_DN67287_c3_g1_i1.p1 TRINITY_DN67287_c3_g1~~TRINITY_DN67287_c3_g1_i1.p1  ORF type:complete len:153 (+),score=19.89 TRINITY_DN67287_c3_g1_i1:34-492(+)